LTGFILAAGFGTRLKPITSHIPKALVPVCGKPLLQRSLNLLSSNDIHRIGVNAHYLIDQMEAFHSQSSIAFDLFYEKESIRGTGGALFFARDFLAHDESFCVCNVDIISDPCIREIHHEFIASGAIAGLVAVPKPERGSIYYDSATKEYGGTPSTGCSLSHPFHADFIGLSFYRNNFLDILTEKDFAIVPAWRRAQEQGLSVKVMILENLVWHDTGSISELANIHFQALQEKFSIDIPSWMIFDAAARRAYHQDLPEEFHTHIGEDVWLELPFIPKNCTIARSVIYQNSSLQAGRRYSDSIVTPWEEVAIGK
jgi:NDP-sugar pyrophosphorylase family protein